MANISKYKLDDGSVITSRDVVAKVKGLSIESARVRLSISSDPLTIFRPKRKINTVCLKSYKLKEIYKRGMYNDMFVLALKKI